MYDQKQMRRFLGIVLIAHFWLAPLASLLSGSDEAALPACCRRHGAHHCAMASAMALASPAQKAIAPAPCPRFTRAHLAILKNFTLFATSRTNREGISLIAQKCDFSSPSSSASDLVVRGPPASRSRA